MDGGIKALVTIAQLGFERMFADGMDVLYFCREEECRQSCVTQEPTDSLRGPGQIYTRGPKGRVYGWDGWMDGWMG